MDDAIQESANKLRRNLLKLIGVGEFSPSAEWRDPCISFVLPEVSLEIYTYMIPDVA